MGSSPIAETMNYEKIYNEIIIRALNSNRSKNNGYFEKHHIVPKSLGGSNKIENLVLLTAREHFICHALLVEIHRKDYNSFCKMLHAFVLMKGENNNQCRYINSKLYEKIKKEYSEIRQKNITGIKLSKEHKNNISKAMIGRVMSDETKKKLSEKASNRIRKPFSDEYKKKMSEIMKNKNINKKAQD